MFLKELDCYFALLQVFLLVVNLFSLILLLLKIYGLPPHMKKEKRNAILIQTVFIHIRVIHM